MKTRWFVGGILTLAALCVFSLELPPLITIERAAYDLLSTLRDSGEGVRVAVVGIDNGSVREMGGTTPPRALMAEAMEKLSGYGATVIAIEETYPSGYSNPGAQALEELLKEYEEKAVSSGGKAGAEREFVRKLKAAEAKADPDAMLKRALKLKARLVLPIWFSGWGSPAAFSNTPDFLTENSVAIGGAGTGGPGEKRPQLRNPFEKLLTSVPQAGSVEYPFEGLASGTRALGHVNVLADADGVVRRAALMAEYDGRLYPSLALQSAIRYKRETIDSYSGHFKSGGVEGIEFSDLRVPAALDFRMNISYGGAPIAVYSFSDLLGDRLKPGDFKQSVVFIGGVSDRMASYDTPAGRPMHFIEIAAREAENILNGNHIVRPAWAFAVEAGLILYFGIFASLILPRVRLSVGGIIAALTILPLLAVTAVLLVNAGLWVRVYSASALLGAAIALMTLKEYVIFGRKREMLSGIVEADKMLGLSFQGQGMLDMALQKFLKCPVKDRSVRELLYNLALDFERKRMPHKALSVYEHILSAGPFRDVAEKAALLKGSSAGEKGTAIRASDSGSTMAVLGNGRVLHTLGRYEIIREIGRGAMGTVYLGRDPRINREVAIKTLHFDEVDEGQIEEFKERFFKEAEAAGRLSHPNIMTIYDAGEEHDMAYLAAEVINGSDLDERCEKDNLLEPEEALRIAASVADALDYAHKHGVIHRDIKPSNVMLLGDGTVKVTDFGIAKVVESTKTRTGTMLGTPSYMSPEQVEGSDIDGRSDLFSLGVTLYEFLSGERPFKGDSIATIMYNLTNCNYTPLKKVISGLPVCAGKLIDSLLAKKPGDRPASGSEAAREMRNCIDAIEGKKTKGKK